MTTSTATETDAKDFPVVCVGGSAGGTDETGLGSNPGRQNGPPRPVYPIKQM